MAGTSINADVINTIQDLMAIFDEQLEKGLTSNPNQWPEFMHKKTPRQMTIGERAYFAGWILLMREAMQPEWAKEIDQEALAAKQQAMEQEQCSIY